MSKFVLTAELQLQAPKNVKQIVNQIQSQLNNININDLIHKHNLNCEIKVVSIKR